MTNLNKTNVATDIAINVNSEWDRLREVIVGYDYDFLFPAWTPEYETIVTKDLQPWFKDHAGEWWSDFDAQGFALLRKQREDMVELLEKLGVAVRRPEKISREDSQTFGAGCGMYQGWLRDGTFTVGNSWIELTPRRLATRLDSLSLRHVSLEKMKAGSKHIAMPPAPPIQDTCEETTQPFLEGGDLFPMGIDPVTGKKRILVGTNVGNTASNQAGADWLQAYLGNEYEVRTTRIREDLIHLDYVLCTPREGLAIVCTDGFIDGLPEWIADWDLIEVSVNKAHNAETNCFVIGDNKIIVAEEHKELAEALRGKGMEVHTTPYGQIFQFGGSFRCTHHPLVRD